MSLFTCEWQSKRNILESTLFWLLSRSQKEEYCNIAMFWLLGHNQTRKRSYMLCFDFSDTIKLQKGVTCCVLTSRTESNYKSNCKNQCQPVHFKSRRICFAFTTLLSTKPVTVQPGMAFCTHCSYFLWFELLHFVLIRALEKESGRQVSSHARPSRFCVN